MEPINEFKMNQDGAVVEVRKIKTKRNTLVEKAWVVIACTGGRGNSEDSLRDLNLLRAICIEVCIYSRKRSSVHLTIGWSPHTVTF